MTQDYVISSVFPIGVFWWMILGHMIHCTLFFIWVFPFEVSHIKFFMSQYNVICYIIKFPPPGVFFWKMIFGAYWSYGQDVFRLSPWVCFKGSNNISDCILWRFSLFFPSGFKELYLLLWIFPIGFFQRFSSYFS